MDSFDYEENMDYNYSDGSKVFFTSDHHFGHANIIRFCNRPWSTISEHNRALIANWNAVVPEDGIVFHLGDFCYKGGGFPAMWWIKGQLHGRIILIRGNHDPDTRKQQNLQQLQHLQDAVSARRKHLQFELEIDDCIKIAVRLTEEELGL